MVKQESQNPEQGRTEHIGLDQGANTYKPENYDSYFSVADGEDVVFDYPSPT